MIAWSSPPKTTAAAWLVLIAATALFGCSRQQPLSPLRSHGAESAAALLPVSSKPALTAAANLDPELQITLPRPSSLLNSITPQTFTVRWEASDLDARSNRPLEYRSLLFDDELEFNTFLFNPDSLSRRDGPSFANWTPVQGNHNELELRDLEINRTYLLLIVAIDDAGRFDRFTLNTNM